MVNCYAGLSERKFRESTQITVFVIPNTVRNPAPGKGKEIHRFALNDKLVVNGYAWYTVSERRGTSPQPPPSKGGRAKQRGMLFLQKGEFAGLNADCRITIDH